jgi:two-component system, LuxR family, sensor kinase FixL
MNTVATHGSRKLLWVLVPAYLTVFVLLDWASYIRPFEGMNITPWNPQPALAIALLLSQPRRLWLVWVGLLAAELVVRGIPADWPGTLVATAALALAYGALARALSHKMDRRLPLASIHDLLWFTLICIVGALFSSLVYVGALIAAGQGVAGPTYEAFARYWVGDGVGLLVTLPILLVLIDPLRRTALMVSLRSRHWWAIAALTVLMLSAVFVQEQEKHFRFFYLLLLPVVWASARFGLAGAVLEAGLLQVGLMVAVAATRHPDITVFELQVLMAAVTMTGLMLGIAVDERARVSVELRSSLRLAAAGQMAAAIAHELGQPLTALSGYARASQLLVDRRQDVGPADVQQLSDISRKIVGETQRAGEVITRLRDFFRSGSTQLQDLSPATIVRQAVEAQGPRAERLGVSIECELQEDLPTTSMDPMQIGVVLRNLISNALDAASSVDGKRQVVVQARSEGSELRIAVRDTGPGVNEARSASIFDAAPSDKPGGMGVGLSLSRAIVEAHGGRLWVESGAGGKFCFSLPSEASPSRSAHAP